MLLHLLRQLDDGRRRWDSWRVRVDPTWTNASFRLLGAAFQRAAGVGEDFVVGEKVAQCWDVVGVQLHLDHPLIQQQQLQIFGIETQTLQGIKELSVGAGVLPVQGQRVQGGQQGVIAGPLLRAHVQAGAEEAAAFTPWWRLAPEAAAAAAAAGLGGLAVALAHVHRLILAHQRPQQGLWVQVICGTLAALPALAAFGSAGDGLGEAAQRITCLVEHGLPGGEGEGQVHGALAQVLPSFLIPVTQKNQTGQRTETPGSGWNGSALTPGASGWR